MGSTKCKNAVFTWEVLFSTDFIAVMLLKWRRRIKLFRPNHHLTQQSLKVITALDFYERGAQAKKFCCISSIHNKQFSDLEAKLNTLSVLQFSILSRSKLCVDLTCTQKYISYVLITLYQTRNVFKNSLRTKYSTKRERKKIGLA